MAEITEAAAGDAAETGRNPQDASTAPGGAEGEGPVRAAATSGDLSILDINNLKTEETKSKIPFIAKKEYNLDKNALHAIWMEMSPHWTQKPKRLFAGSIALTRDYGGIAYAHEITGLHFNTIKHGISEIQNMEHLSMRDRKSGGGRPRKPVLCNVMLEVITCSQTCGDPKGTDACTDLHINSLAYAYNAIMHVIFGADPAEEKDKEESGGSETNDSGSRDVYAVELPKDVAALIEKSIFETYENSGVQAAVILVDKLLKFRMAGNVFSLESVNEICNDAVDCCSTESVNAETEPAQEEAPQNGTSSGTSEEGSVDGTRGIETEEDTKSGINSSDAGRQKLTLYEVMSQEHKVVPAPPSKYFLSRTAVSTRLKEMGRLPH